MTRLPTRGSQVKSRPATTISGNGLTMATWAHRHDREKPATDTVVAGPVVDVLLRLGGHRDLVTAWHSGCVVCLYSCPGSKIGNATATVRDFVDEKVRFRVKPDVLPPDGTRVGVVVWLAEKR